MDQVSADDFGLMVFSREFQSYEANGMAIMKGHEQWNCINGLLLQMADEDKNSVECGVSPACPCHKIEVNL